MNHGVPGRRRCSPVLSKLAHPKGLKRRKSKHLDDGAPVETAAPACALCDPAPENCGAMSPPVFPGGEPAPVPNCGPPKSFLDVKSLVDNSPMKLYRGGLVEVLQGFTRINKAAHPTDEAPAEMQWMKFLDDNESPVRGRGETDSDLYAQQARQLREALADGVAKVLGSHSEMFTEDYEHGVQQKAFACVDVAAYAKELGTIEAIPPSLPLHRIMSTLQAIGDHVESCEELAAETMCAEVLRREAHRGLIEAKLEYQVEEELRIGRMHLKRASAASTTTSNTAAP